ncbi:hypothetical protein [uncultured Tenacibaculum sp.]|uniref:hypothetical protein n=1 Tax=uncultured Tenacibaculum sp. TaxID=174713 RepID=UPI00260EB701|nr:hypothetical protein [uncultured Tenacibaculum sp.]
MKYSKGLLVACLLGSFILVNAQETKQKEVKKVVKKTAVVKKSEQKKKTLVQAKTTRNQDPRAKTLKIVKAKSKVKKKNDDTTILKKEKN